METTSPDIKVVYLSAMSSVSKRARVSEHIPKGEQPPQKKVITTTQKWKHICAADLEPEKQLELLHASHKFYNGDAPPPPPPHYGIIIDHIKQKIGGYRAQDQLKEKYCAAEFVDIARVFEMLVSCNMECHYCKKPVMLLYEYVREPQQWSLDRIDNTRGHDRDNLYIACLTCNLRRRTIKAERYELTKKCVNVRREGHGSTPLSL